MTRSIISTVTSLILFVIGIQPTAAQADSYPPCTITGTIASETINGTDQDDVICFFGGEDRVLGGGGNDLFIATGEVIATVLGGFGNDTVDLKQATSGTVYASLGDDVIYGSPGKDTLKGDGGDDVIYGYGGDDTITDSSGTNSLYGGENHDRITGGDNADSIFGEAGSDTLRGGFGDDIISGGDYIDALYGDLGNDILDGGAGDDELSGNRGDDLLRGGDGNDVILGEDNNDTLQGGNGNDRLLGGYGIDNLQGGAGSNTCDFDFGEPKDKFCVFEKKDPNLEIVIPQTVDVSDAEGAVVTRIRSQNIEGFKDIQIKCGAAILKIDFENKKIINSHGSSKEVPLIIQTPPLNFPVNLYPKLYIAKNATGGEFQCTSSVTDFYGTVLTKNETKLKVYSEALGQPSAPNRPKFEWTSPTAGVLSWSAPSFVGTPKFSSYQVQFSENGGGWATLSNGSTKSTSVKISGLGQKSNYSYRIRAINTITAVRSTGYMKLQWADLQTQVTSTRKIAAPQKLSIGFIADTGASLSWASVISTKKITDYKVSISTDGKTWLVVDRAGSKAANQTLSGLVTKTKYFVRVAAMSSAEVGYSTYAAFTTK